MPPLDRNGLFCVALVGTLGLSLQAHGQGLTAQDTGARFGSQNADLGTARLTTETPTIGTAAGDLGGTRELGGTRLGGEMAVTSIRSRQIELHYQITSTAQDAQVELWYTRDRGTTWQACGKDEDRISPVVFTAPSEGLYGFTLIASVGNAPARPAPTPYEPPQRWCSSIRHRRWPSGTASSPRRISHPIASFNCDGPPTMTTSPDVR